MFGRLLAQLPACSFLEFSGTAFASELNRHILLFWNLANHFLQLRALSLYAGLLT